MTSQLFNKSNLLQSEKFKSHILKRNGRRQEGEKGGKEVGGWKQVQKQRPCLLPVPAGQERGPTIQCPTWVVRVQLPINKNHLSNLKQKDFN